MSPLPLWPRFHGHRPGGQAHGSHPAAVVLGIIGLSLLASTAQVVGSASAGQRVELRVSEVVPPLPDEDAAANFDAGVMAASLVDLPPASVDAISL